ncbi:MULTISPECIES: hypothetical protein [unclassified Paenibacillus]
MNTRLNWEKLLNPHCPAMSEIFCRVMISNKMKRLPHPLHHTRVEQSLLG